MIREKRIACTIRGTLLTLFTKECENLALKEAELIKLALNSYLRDKGSKPLGVKDTSPIREQ